MAAPIRFAFRPHCHLHSLFSLCFAHRSYTYCQRHFIQRFCNTLSSSTPDSIITKDSKVDEKVAYELKKEHIGSSGHIKYKNHPGVMRRSRFQLPVRLIKAIQILLEKYPVEEISSKTGKLVRYLQQRQPPLSNHELTLKAKEIESKILAKDGEKLYSLTGEEFEAAVEKHKAKVVARLRQNVYHWKPIQYDAFTSYVYLLGRIASDFSVLLQCYTEISKRDPRFSPTSVYNHGSRVGASIWAADRVWKTIGEHYCVEESGHMNTIARLLLQGGNEQETVSYISGVHFRQFHPSPKEHKFSMVVSAYTLMEQPSQKDRLELVLNLWEMTESYLILVENGTTAGFSLINEARDFLLHLSEGDAKHPFVGHVFAPCPHDKPCPKLHTKNQPCLTECVSSELDFTSSTQVEKSKKNARYSYVILKKGPRIKTTEWPRVLHQIQAQRHIHCHLCLPCGHLQHVVITKGKFEKHLYNCTKYLTQGDRLPVSLSNQPRPSISPETTSLEEDTQRHDKDDGIHDGIDDSKEDDDQIAEKSDK